MSGRNGGCPLPEAWSAYVDRETAPGESLALRAHLESCPVCRLEVRAIQAGRKALRAAPVPAMPDDLRRTLEGMAARRYPAPPAASAAPWGLPAWVRFLLSPAVLAPAAASALLAALWLGRREPPRLELAAEPVELPMELVVSAHNRYALTLPLAPADELFSEPSAQLAGGSMEAGDVH